MSALKLSCKIELLWKMIINENVLLVLTYLKLQFRLNTAENKHCSLKT